MAIVLYLFGSGLALYGGLLLLVAGMLFGLATGALSRRIGLWLVLLGSIFIAASAAPLPYWLYGLAASLTLLHLATAFRNDDRWNLRRRWIVAAALLAWCAAAACDVPYLLTPKIAVPPGGEVHIVADSITAGIGGESFTWPELVAQALNLQIHNHARAAATVKLAQQQAASIPDDDALVVLEIGGNDVLSSTPTAVFEADLDALLAQVATGRRSVVMFELPLPPLCIEYGRIQRRVAAKHGVPLIPKRHLMYVLTAADATSDTIHLTPAGHRQMAHFVASVLHRAE